jgi:hypothetical protein
MYFINSVISYIQQSLLLINCLLNMLPLPPLLKNTVLTGWSRNLDLDHAHALEKEGRRAVRLQPCHMISE